MSGDDRNRLIDVTLDEGPGMFHCWPVAGDAFPEAVEALERATPEEEALADQVRDWLDMIEASANGVTGGMPVLIASMTDAILKGCFDALEHLDLHIPSVPRMYSR